MGRPAASVKVGRPGLPEFRPGSEKSSPGCTPFEPPHADGRFSRNRGGGRVDDRPSHQVEASMTTLPPFSVLRANYPSKAEVPTKDLLDGIGGQVAALRHVVNTCALRMSVCLTKSGAPLLHVGGLTAPSGVGSLVGRGPARSPGRRYLIRVHDMKTYLERVYGRATSSTTHAPLPRRSSSRGRNTCKASSSSNGSGARASLVRRVTSIYSGSSTKVPP
jgi:hypothetical protein